jgi:hypothetical protein|tara:strand:+ start:1313 stop:2494 length:1182 start_codon:yes stop_codon:yes gene_type:complete
MSEFNTETITDRAGTGKPDLTFGFKINGSDSGINPFLHTESANEPSNPNNGDAWLDTANDVYKVYIDNEWKDFFGTTASLWYGDRAVRVGVGRVNPSQLSGSAANVVPNNQIHRYDITTLGDAVDFKDRTVSAIRQGGCSNASNAYIFGGTTTGENFTGAINTIEYFSISNSNNAQDFGDLSAIDKDNATVSDGTYGVHSFGYGNTASYSGSIEYITMDTTGNASDFGDRTIQSSLQSSVNNATRGCFAAGYDGSTQNTIDYITMATPGNATDFGDLTVVGYGFDAGAGSGSGDRGLFGSMLSRTGVIDYITISTTGNATDFGDLFVGLSLDSYQQRYGGATSNATRAVFSASANSDVMQYVTMSTTGNAVDFGDQVSSTANDAQCNVSGNAS